MRQCLHMVLAPEQVERTDHPPEIDLEEEYEEEEVTKYTMADAELVEAQGASIRLEREEKCRVQTTKRKQKEDSERSELDELNDAAWVLQKRRSLM